MQHLPWQLILIYLSTNRITSWLNDCGASVLIYALVINDAKRIHTYIHILHVYIVQIYHTQWSIHMNAICKYDSHPVTQSFTRPALLFTHTTHSTQIWNHKRDNQPSSIVLNRKTGFYSDSASLYAFRGAACFLEHSGVAGKGQRFLPKSGWGAPKCGNTQYPKYYLDLIESEAKGELAREPSWAIWPTMLHNA